MNPTKYWYRCIKCGGTFPPDRPYYTCSQCGDLLLVEQDLDFIRSQFLTREALINHIETLRRLPRSSYPLGSGVFRWFGLLMPGFPLEHALSLGEGNTDLWEPPDWLKQEIGLKRLYIKLEGQAPSGSFKDRGMPVPISDALRLQVTSPDLGIEFVACASTGDTSASAAKYAAYVRHLLRCLVLVASGKISPAQMYQAEDCGAIVMALKASGFNACMDVVAEFCRLHPEIVLVNSKNALRIVGQETISLEIWQDLGWKVPDWIVIPCGNAGNITAQMSAWLLLLQLGFIDHLPGIICAQTKVSNTLVRWINSGFKVYEPGQEGPTVASAMNIQGPVSFPRIDFLRQAFEIHGYDVSEEDIVETRARFNRAGAGLCPQGAVAVNAALQAREVEVIRKDDITVTLSTALDLKFVGSGVEYHETPSAKFGNQPILVEPDLEAVEAAFAQLRN